MAQQETYLEVGETGIINGIKVRCVAASSEGGVRNLCKECAFCKAALAECASIRCTPFDRPDHNNVLFIKLEEA